MNQTPLCDSTPREKAARLPGGRPARRCLPLFVSTHATGPWGTAVFIRDLADAVDVVAEAPVSAVVAFAKTPAAYLNDDRVMFLVRQDAREACRHAAALANELPCTVVNVHLDHSCGPDGWGEAVVDFARACRKPVVATLHALSVEPGTRQKRNVSMLAEVCRRIVVGTAAAAEVLAGVYGVAPQRIERIPLATHRLSCDDRDWLRHRAAIPGGPLLLTAGPLNPRTGVECTIEALPDVLASCPNATYVIVGSTGGEEAKAYRGRLEQEARRLGVLDHLHFDERPLSLYDLLLYVRSADVFVSPCVEADGLLAGPLAHAVAAGKPIVSTPCLYGRELAERGAAVLADFGDARSLARAVLRVLNDVALRVRLQEAAARLARDLTWDAVAGRYLSLFRSITPRKAA